MKARVNVEILYEDEDILVVNKPSGMAVHASSGHEEGALVDVLLAHCPAMKGVGSEARSGVVHRLDMATSGVMVFAKNANAYRALREQFESHESVEKTYLAVVRGVPKERKGTIDAAIGRKAWDSKRMAVDGLQAKRAVTHWEVLSKKGGLALIEFRIETGRTHQIRVHAAFMGHPIVGDELYGDAAKERKAGRLLLHAVELEFMHPRTHRRVKFAACPPREIVYAC